MSVGLIGYYLAVKPLQEPFLNRLEVFNELCILVASYVLVAFTDCLDNPIDKFNAGWTMAAVIIICAIVNMALIFWKVGSTIVNAIKNKIRLSRLKKYQVEHINKSL